MGIKPSAFTCVRWEVTLCDPTWQAMLHSSEMHDHYELRTIFLNFVHNCYTLHPYIDN